jgi:hypothetical protein
MMAARKKCGAELCQQPGSSLGDDFLRLTSYPLRHPFGYAAAGFILAGPIGAGAVLAVSIEGDNEIAAAAFFIVLACASLTLAILLLSRMRQSRREAEYCPRCTAILAARGDQRQKDLPPHKIALMK